MGKLFTGKVGKVLTRLLGNYLTAALGKVLTELLGKVLDIYIHRRELIFMLLRVIGSWITVFRAKLSLWLFLWQLKLRET